MSPFISLAIVHMLAVASPGPDFAIVLRNALASGRRAGLLTAAGIALGISIHLTYTIFGFGALMAGKPYLFNIIRIAGSCYLGYLGVMSLRAAFRKFTAEDEHAGKRQSLFGSFRGGFVTNILNVNAILYMISFVSQWITVKTPLYDRIIFSVEILVISFVWFSFVAAMMTITQLRRQFYKIKRFIDVAIGIAFLAFAFRMALAIASK
jgi:RhtB (resistance to homoserine/threonine) family protein